MGYLMVTAWNIFFSQHMNIKYGIFNGYVMETFGNENINESTNC